MKKEKSNKSNAFSLVEIIIALSILTIISLLIVRNTSGRTTQAMRTRAVIEIEQSLASALDEYEADNGRYPTTEQGLQALIKLPASAPVPPNWNGPYLKKKNIADPWGNPYVYKSPGINNSHFYDLSTLGADGKEGGEGIDQDINNWE